MAMIMLRPSSMKRPFHMVGGCFSNGFNALLEVQDTLAGESSSGQRHAAGFGQKITGREGGGWEFGDR